MRRRQLKSINIPSVEKIPVKEIPNIPNLKNLIFSESYEAIKSAHDSLQERAVLFEINNSGYILELKHDYWIDALKESIKYYEKDEEFEKCILCNNLINQINEKRGNPKDNSSNKQYSKRRNASKKTKKERSISK